MKQVIYRLGLASLFALTGSMSVQAFQKELAPSPRRTNQILIANPLILKAKEIDRRGRAYSLGLQLAVEKGWIDYYAPEYYTWSYVGGMINRGKSIEDACLWADCDPKFGYKILKLGENAFASAQREQQLEKILQTR